MKRLRAIFFDATDTLIRLPHGPALHYMEVAQRHAVTVPRPVMETAFRQAWREMPTPPVTRVPRPDDDRGWWRDLVGRTLDHCGVPPAALDRDAYFAELYATFARPGVWDVFPETREILASLAERFQLVVVSNFDTRLRTVLADLDLANCFQHVIISSEVGADKPEPWIFEEALRRVGVDAHEALHVGDDPQCDWEGGAQAGLQVFKLQRPGNSLRDLLTLLE